MKYISLNQDDREDVRPPDSHFGAWVICTEQPSPFRVGSADGHELDGTCYEQTTRELGVTDTAAVALPTCLPARGALELFEQVFVTACEAVIRDL